MQFWEKGLLVGFLIGLLAGGVNLLIEYDGYAKIFLGVAIFLFSIAGGVIGELIHRKNLGRLFILFGVIVGSIVGWIISGGRWYQKVYAMFGLSLVGITVLGILLIIIISPIIRKVRSTSVRTP